MSWSRSKTLSLMFYNSSRGLKLAYAVTPKSIDETKQAVLILHGLLGSKRNWRSISHAIENRLKCQVYAADLRNHGDSPHHHSMGVDEMARDVVELIEDLSLNKRRLVLMGHSLGGRVAALIALNEPRLLDTLLMADVTPKKMTRPDRTISDVLEALNACKLRGQSEEVGKNAFADLMAILNDRAVVEFILTNLTMDNNNTARWKFNLEAIVSSLDNILKIHIQPGQIFEKPTCIIRGGKSKYVQDSDIPMCRRLFPQLQVYTIQQAGHWVHAERPAEFLDICVKFLEQSQ